LSLQFGLCQTAKIRNFGLSHKEKTAKSGFAVFESNFFSKKMKKMLARNEISCTFAAAFGNE
jgi:hypothetical protein